MNPPNKVKEDWTISLTDLEVYSSFSNITEENNKFELFKFLDEKKCSSSYEKVGIEIEKDLEITDIKATDLKNDIKSPINIDECGKLVTKRQKDDKYMKFLAGCFRFIFQDFQSYPRTEIDLVEEDIRLVVDDLIQVFSIMN